MKLLKSASALTILLTALGSPSIALSLSALTYQEALNQCQMGYIDACRVAQEYQSYFAGSGGGSPADAWVSPDELRDARPGVFSTYDFIRD